MSHSQIQSESILTLFDVVLKKLSPKEQIIISKRSGLWWHKETLENIGKLFTPNLTRERVRQIEHSSIEKIGRIVKKTTLIQIHDFAKDLLQKNEGILGKDRLIREIIRNFSLDEEMNVSILEIIIQSDYDILKSKPTLGIKTYFYLPDINKNIAENIHKQTTKILSEKNVVLEKDVVFMRLRKELSVQYSDLFFTNVLWVFEDILITDQGMIGLGKWESLNPRTLKAKALYVLQKEGIPMHFVTIANQISQKMNAAVKTTTVHNELIRNPEFILVGRGLYALKEWWLYYEGTVAEVIVEFMKKNKGPMSREEIVSAVTKVKKVKPATIYINLQNKKFFQRVGRNFYDLKK